MAAPILVVTGPSGAGKTAVGRLVAAAFELSAHVQADDFWPFVVNGWIEPSLPACSHVDRETFVRLHARFADLGDHEANVIDVPGAPEDVAAALLSAFTGGRLVEIELVGGVEPRNVDLVAHDPAWAARFESERRRIVDALGGGVRVEHIGSTAVPGLAAKPIVDLQVSVADVRDDASYVPALIAAGYELRVRERGHRMLRTPERDVHVHVCDADGKWEHRHLAFRDQLRSSAADRDRYAAAKRLLAVPAQLSMNDYAAAKSDVIAEMMKRPPQ